RQHIRTSDVEAVGFIIRSLEVNFGPFMSTRPCRLHGTLLPCATRGARTKRKAMLEPVVLCDKEARKLLNKTSEMFPCDPEYHRCNRQLIELGKFLSPATATTPLGVAVQAPPCRAQCNCHR